MEDGRSGLWRSGDRDGLGTGRKTCWKVMRNTEASLAVGVCGSATKILQLITGEWRAGVTDLG